MSDEVQLGELGKLRRFFCIKCRAITEHRFGEKQGWYWPATCVECGRSSKLMRYQPRPRPKREAE